MTFTHCVKSAVLVAFLAFAALPGASAAADLTPIATLTATSDGTTIPVRVGDVVAIALEGGSGTGFAWTVDRISTDGATLIGEIAFAAPAQTGPVPILGRPGTYTANFRALKPGPVTIDLKYARPFEASAPPAKTFAVTFDVAAAGAPKFFNAILATPKSTIAYSDGASYTGALAGGLRSGFGTTTYAPTDRSGAVRAEGTWRGGALSEGLVTFGDGSRYFGALDDSGNFSGPARFEYPGGVSLRSTFRAGAFSGRTTLVAAAGARSGWTELVVDQATPATELAGRATETFANGYTLEGTMRDGTFEGPVVYRSPATARLGGGTVLRGRFTGGRLDGPYAFTDARGARLTGTIANGSLQGRATLTARDGSPCRGEVSRSGDFYPFSGPLDGEGRPNGRGTYGCPHEQHFTGRWTHGKAVGTIAIRLPNGVTYALDLGSKPTDRFAGPARVTLPTGEIETGRLERDGSRDGGAAYRFTEDEETPG